PRRADAPGDRHTRAHTLYGSARAWHDAPMGVAERREHCPPTRRNTSMAHHWVNEWVSEWANDFRAAREAARLAAEQAATLSAERTRIVEQLWEDIRVEVQSVMTDVNRVLPELAPVEMATERTIDPARIIALRWKLGMPSTLQFLRIEGDRQIGIATMGPAGTPHEERCDIAMKHGAAALIRNGREVEDISQEFIRPWLQRFAGSPK